MDIQHIATLVKETKGIITNREMVAHVREKGVADYVTQVDITVQEFLKDALYKLAPDIQFLGEETGLQQMNTDSYWILDPVDGTRPFLCGLPVWGTLIGLLYRERAVMGMMSQPFTGEKFWADGHAAWYSGPHGSRRMTSRKNIPLDQAIVHTTSPEPVERNPHIRFRDLTERTLMTRYGGECYATAMMAAGQIDICVEYGLQPYDIAAFIPIIEQAGGVVSTIDGGRPESGGAIVAAGCPHLHEQALKILNG